MNFDVFISYAHQDKAAADAACAKIEADGIRCWIAPRDVPPGAEWAGAIIKAIDNCRVMVLIFSSSTNGSRQIDREAQRAFDKEKSVIPFRIEDVAPQQSLAYYLGPVHWLDALTPPLDQHLQKLSTSVKAFVQADKPSDDKEPPALQKTEARQESEAKRRADEETQRKKDVAEAQRIAEEQGRQEAEAERLAQEEKGRIRATETARLAEQETQKKRATSETAAPSKKEALRRNLTLGALGTIAVIVAIAIWFLNLAPSNNSATATQTCDQGTDANAVVAACTQLIALNPKDEIAYSNRCRAYSNVGNYSAAITDCNQAIALNPKNVIAYVNGCSVYIDLSNYTAAIADCNQAIALNPKSGDAYTDRCGAYSGLGQYRAGLTDCNQAIALNPRDGNAYFNRGGIYEKLGKNAEAIADYQQALAIDPSDQVIQNILKRLGASPGASGSR
jgi:tetratricopeptide (TPR) repeat protein